MIDMFKVTPKKRTVLIKGKKGVIYSNPNNFSKFLFWLGNVSLVVAFGFFVYLYYPLANSLYNYHSGFRPEKTVEKKFEDVENSREIASNFRLIVEKIGADVEVVSNVSIFDKKIYREVLKNNQIAHAQGTYLPGSGKGTSSFLFAHSSSEGIDVVRNNTIFYLLGELDDGDEFVVEYNGKIYAYKVFDKKVVGANEVSYLTYSDPNKEVMILQTCWPIGTDWRRLLVLGELK